MNVYDKAYELAKAMRECPEAAQLKEAKLAAGLDPDAKRMLEDFRRKQNELQQKLMAGEEPSAGDMERLNRLYEVVALNPLIHRVLESERRFAVMFDDVNKMLNDVLKSVAE